MAQKQKQQVKYDPSLSDVKRLGAIQKRDGGKVTIVIKVIIVLMSYIMTIVWAVLPFIKNGIEPDDHIGIMINGYITLIFAFFATMFNHLMTSISQIKESHANSKGCMAFTEVLCTMPVTRLSVQKYNFRNFMKFFALPVTAEVLLLNIYSLAIPEMARLRTTIGFSTVFCSFVLLGAFFYLLTLDQPAKNAYKVRSFVMVMLFYLLLFISISDRAVKYISKLAVMKNFSGAAGIAILAAMAAVMVLVEKIYYEKKLVNSAWFEVSERKAA